MARQLSKTVLVCVAAGYLLWGCAEREGDQAGPAGLRVEKVKVIDGLDLPECVVIDPNDEAMYISNVVTASEAYWVDDSNGFISLAAADGEIEQLRWIESTSDVSIHDPKGMCILDGKLYFSDNSMLKYRALKDGSRVEIIEVPGAGKLNDLATDGRCVWASDSETGKVFCIEPDGTIRRIKGPAGINGITWHKDTLYAVSWDLHEVYELDPDGEAEPSPFGLSEHFTALDGIEVLDDGTFIVSDYMGNKLCAIEADRKTVHTLMELESPADIGLDRNRMLLYVPEMLADRVTVLKLRR